MTETSSQQPSTTSAGGGDSAAVSAETESQAWRIQLGAGAIATLAGVGLLAIFMVQNTQSVEVRFLLLSFSWPLWLLIIVSALIGALVWFGLGVLRRHRRRRARRQERRS